MTSDPDVTPVGFAATDSPGAIVRRRRNPVWLVLTILLVTGGVAGPVWFVLAQAENAPGRDEAVAHGTIAEIGATESAPVHFDGEGDFTVWLDAEGVTRSNKRETIVAASNCAAVFENGGSARFRGARQGASVTIGNRATIGTFQAPAGAIAVSCRLLPFGRYGNRFLLRNERPFFVTPGRPGVGFLPWGAMFGGIVALLVAAVTFGRYRTGTLTPRRRPGRQAGV